MLSLGGERLPPLPTKKKKKEFWNITCTTIWVCYHYYRVFFCSFTHLRIPDHHQNVISSSLHYPGPHPKISSQSVHNSLSNIVHKQTNRQTSTTKNITSFAKELMREVRVKKRKQSVYYLLIMHPGLKIHNVVVKPSLILDHTNHKCE